MIFQKYSQIGESLTTYFFRKYILYYIIKLDRKKYEQYRLLLLVRLKIMLNCPTMRMRMRMRMRIDLFMPAVVLVRISYSFVVLVVDLVISSNLLKCSCDFSVVYYMFIFYFKCDTFF